MDALCLAEEKVPKIDACSIDTLGQIFQDFKRFEDWLFVARKPCGGLADAKMCLYEELLQCSADRGQNTD